MRFFFQPSIEIVAYRTANACFKEAADLHAELEQYPQAITRYEEVAKQSLSSPLTKYSVKEYWLRSGLCALALGVSNSFVSESLIADSSSGFGNSKKEYGDL